MVGHHLAEGEDVSGGVREEGVVWRGGRKGRSLAKCKARGRGFTVRGRGCGEKGGDEEKGGPHRRRRGEDEIPPRLPRFIRSIRPP
ncbi:hypothetical protein QVD17_05392 [Tagetes erecta]|uniref:Uncharacterized protein n=1 Tax=Tagetes erecta TaxID=13708 RepID=A0AAD8LJN2_TARER|nr:hypothetical protein QVD17_05392 [Tagetes erecta]